MSTLARRHFQRVVAAAQTGESVATTHVQANAYELQLAQLHEDRRRLKQVQSVERKIAAKRQMLPQYLPWVRGTLEGGRGGQDDVVMTMMVWAVDVGEIELGIDIAEHAFAHGLTMPDQFNRDVATYLTEEVAGLVLAAVPESGAVDMAELLRLAALVEGRDMPDEVRAKLSKALGIATVDGAPLEEHSLPTLQAALAHLRRALQLHDKVGVKKDIERLERAIKNKPSSTTAADPAASPSSSEGSSQDDAQGPAT